MAKVVVVGLGPAGPEQLSAAAAEAIAATPTRFLRTAKHPAATAVEGAGSFDHHYVEAASFDDVYARIVDDLVAAACHHGEVLYAVPGSPLVLERSVELLRSDGRVEVELVPSMSFLDLAWERLGIDPIDTSVRLVDGHRFSTAAAGQRGPLLVAHVHDRWVCSDIKLAVEDPPRQPVTVLQRLGLPEEAVFQVPWAELDRSFEPDHLTALWIPELDTPVAGELQRFVELVATLRRSCPWDRRQTHASLTRHLLEEAYETIDALQGLAEAGIRGALDGNGNPIDDGTDPEVAAAAYSHLEEELGDLLFQVGFHARIAAEQGAFTLADVARGITDKLVARHPHVFRPPRAGAEGEPDAAALSASWEQAKKEEKGRGSVMDGIPRTLPALAYASKVVSKATAVVGEASLPVLAAGADAPGAASSRRGPVAPDHDLGDRLLAWVVEARRAGVDPEQALRASADRLANTIRAAEAEAAQR